MQSNKKNTATSKFFVYFFSYLSKHAFLSPKKGTLLINMQYLFLLWGNQFDIRDNGQMV